MHDEIENPMVIGEYYAEEEPRVFEHCDQCGGAIYEDETFYLIDCCPVCQKCMQAAERTAG